MTSSGESAVVTNAAPLEGARIGLGVWTCTRSSKAVRLCRGDSPTSSYFDVRPGRWRVASPSFPELQDGLDGYGTGGGSALGTLNWVAEYLFSSVVGIASR